MKMHFYRVVGTREVFLFAVAAPLIVGAVWPVAAQMKKEGTFSGTWGGYGICKSMALGKDRVLLDCDENSFTITDGFLDHMSWHCWGGGDFVKGIGAPHGSCVGTDSSGDQIVFDFAHERHAIDDKSPRATVTFTGGTGKYAGVSGGFPYVNDYNAFRTAVPGTYVSHVASFQGNYKLP
jgi:hypothetical protein